MNATIPELPGYHDGRELGRGGYAVVYLYRDPRLGEDVAVKLLQLTDASARAQFADEIRVLSSFRDNPLIVHYLDHGALEDGRPYFVMRYCPGGSLSKWVGEHGLPVAEVIDTGLRIGRALDAVHRRHWLHRDIKPSNILVDEQGHAPRLSDFGIATPSRPDGRGDQGDPAVSVAWSAPEVITKESRGSVASDVYSLGATLWHLLTGRSPYEIRGGDNTADALERRIVGGRLPGLGRDNVPTGLEHLLRSMLEHRPQDRPRNVADVVSVLELLDAQLQAAPASVAGNKNPDADEQKQKADTAGGPGGTATADEPVQPPPGPPRHGKRRVLVLAAAVVVAVGALTAAALLAHPSASAAAHASGGGSGSATAESSADPGGQDAGVLGDDVPPGTPAVSAQRADSTTIRFTWTYAAQQATDTFEWRALDGAGSGVSKTTTIELSDPAGQRLCIEVRVVRAEGGGQGSAWSPAGCGS